MNDWLVLVLIYLTLFIGSTLIILLHELGHAFAYLWLTKPDSIDIYVGSYGNKLNSFDFKQGKINIYIKRSWWIFLGGGMCVSSKVETDYRKHIIVLLAGVLFTFFIALIASVVVFFTHPVINIQVVFYVFLGLSVLSLLGNLIPLNHSGSRYSYGNEGANLESDGKQIFFALKTKRFYATYREALQCMMNKDYGAAMEKLQAVNKSFPQTEKILRNLYACCMFLKRYADADRYLDQLAGLGELQLIDIINKGCLCSFMGKHDEAIALYQKALKKNRNHYIALNNLGYEMIKKGAHIVAAQLLEKSLKLKPGFSMAICNMAYSKILEGDVMTGKRMIDKVLEKDPGSASAWFYLSIYNLKMNDREQAELNLAKALELDDTMPITDYNEELEKLTLNVQS